MSGADFREALTALAVILAPLLLAWALVTWGDRRRKADSRSEQRHRP